MNLVFASGFLFPQKIVGENYFRDLPRKFPDALFPNVPVAGTVEERAQELAKQIRGRFSHGEVHIIAHSMGGLDARYLLAQNLHGLADRGRIVSLSTIATPHHGSPVADLLVGPKPDLLDPRRFAYETVSRALSQLAIQFGALGNLTTGFTEQFNRDNPQLDHIRYFAYAGSGNGSFVLLPTHTYIEFQGKTDEEKTNDGLVSVASAKWPDKLMEPPWPTDHLGEVGHNLNSLDLKLKFDHLAAFGRIVQNAVAPRP